MKNLYGCLFVTAIFFGIVFGWKGLLVIGSLFPTVWLSSLLESDSSPKADQDTDTASLVAASLGEENGCLGDTLDGAEGSCDCNCDSE